MTIDAATAWVGGRAADPGEAVAAAAALLSRSASAVIAGLGTDIAGAEAAIALARRVGGCLDHAEAAAGLRDLDVMREAGWIVTTPLQAHARADLLLLVGPGLEAGWPGLGALLRPGPPPLAPDRPRRVMQLDGPGLPDQLGALRALARGRRVGPGLPPGLAEMAAALAGARYGVAVWSAAALDGLSIEMLCGLIDDLNATTRFAGLPLPPGDNFAGVAQAGGWRDGFPVRVGFGRGAPEHDPWRFDAVRLVDSGEADAAVWVSAFTARAPGWRRPLPTVALCPPGGAPAAAEVTFAVGCPGVDHDSVLFDPGLGTLGFRAASAATGAAPVADVLGRILAALELPC